MDEQGASSRFQTTSWTMILRARSSREDLDRLVSIYWSPVFAYLRRRGHDTHDAADLTQAFLTRKVLLESRLVSQADPRRGRFRTFLLAALQNYVIDTHRAAAGRAGGRDRHAVSMDMAALEAADPGTGGDPAAAFTRQWATTVLGEVLRRLESACARDGLQRHWTVFEARLLRPITSPCEPVSINDLVEQLGARDRSEVYSMLSTVKRKFRSIERDVVAETLDEGEDLESELAELHRCLVGETP